MAQIRCPKCGWKGWPVSNSFCYNKIQSNVCMQNIKK